MSFNRRINSLNVIGLVLGLLGVLSLSACHSSMSEICSKRLPEFDQELEGAIFSLGPWVSGRQLASVGTVVSGADEEVGLARDDRESWKGWAEVRLVEAQVYIDSAAADPRALAAREALTDLANQFVTFHGYATAGRAGKMVATLERIRKRAGQVRQIACERP